MNNDYFRGQTPRYRSYQLLSDTIRNYNHNVRLNNQQMLEYNRNIHELIILLRETTQQENSNRPMQSPPPTPRPTYARRHFNTLPRHSFSDIVRNYNPMFYTENSDINRNEQQETRQSRINTNVRRRERSRTLGDLISNNRSNNAVNSGIEEEINSHSENTSEPLDPSANIRTNSTVRTFTTTPNSTLSTSFHNASRNSISNIYHLLRRDFVEIMGFNNFVETTDENNGLTDEERDIGLFDTSYNADVHASIDTQCPISLDDFQENESITQIVECGHIFKTQHIMTWFENRTKCPKCRCELRVSNDSSEVNDVSFNVVTPLENMNEDDIERQIDELTRIVTNSMIEDINRNVEISINSDVNLTNLPIFSSRRPYVSSRRNNVSDVNVENTSSSSSDD